MNDLVLCRRRGIALTHAYAERNEAVLQAVHNGYAIKDIATAVGLTYQAIYYIMKVSNANVTAKVKS